VISVVALGSEPRDGKASTRVVAAVARGEAGLILSREASRLSRTDKDWCHLLEVCQIFDTLIADYEVQRAFDQFNAVDARNRLVAAELERRWNAKMEAREELQRKIASLETAQSPLSPADEEKILA
jgi:predicted RNA-binding Zn ribbon-like protein